MALTLSGSTDTGYGVAGDTNGVRVNINGTTVATFGTTGKSLALEGASAQTGTGITFPASQNASSDANTLDDYEEGTWTVTVTGTSTAGTASYSAQMARYTKVGRLVNIQLFVVWNTGTGTGNLQLSGLPFTNGSVWAVTGGFCADITLSASNVFYAGIAPSVSVIGIDQYPVGGGTATNVAYDANGSLGFSLTYSV